MLKYQEKLKEFVADLKAYFNSIGYNRSREANALKDQVGEAVYYAESIVALFDKVAVEAVENYQATASAKTDKNTVQHQNREYLSEERKKDVNAERREETRDDFYRRSHEEKYTVRERGKISVGYRAVFPEHFSRSAKAVEREIKKLGIKAIIHNGLEANANGITQIIKGEATTIYGDAVYIRNSVGTDPVETAGHEAFHFWKNSETRTAYREIVEENIIFSSNAFIDFQSEIAEAYIKYAVLKF